MYYDDCLDDRSWVDNSGDDCEWYDSYSDSCGVYGEGAWEACCACGGGDWEEDWTDDMDWTALDELAGAFIEDGESWSIGSVTVTYNDAASKLVATVGVTILATALAQ